MKKLTIYNLFAILTAFFSITHANGQVVKNSATVLPKTFYQEKLTEYNRMKTPEVKFSDFYNAEEARFYQNDALKRNPGLAYIVSPGAATTICGNGDFEQASLSPEWQGAYGSVLPTGEVQYSRFVSGISSNAAITNANSRQTLVKTGRDPNVPISTTAPGSSQSVRIGNAAIGSGAELLSKTFVVTQPFVSFWYALVLQDPAHRAWEQPGFRVRILNTTTGAEIPGLTNLGNGRDSTYAQASNPFFISLPGSDLVYRDWSCATIDLSAQMGNTITVQFVTKDCSQGAHYGYAYVDDFCGMCNNPWKIQMGSSTGCGNGNICVDYTLPANIGKSAGNLDIKLNIYQNGSLVRTLSSGVLTSGSNYCFQIDPTALGLNTALGGFDYTLTGNFGLGALGNLSPQFLYAAPDGKDPGLNNDYRIACETIGCCPGTNLIVNPSFEDGNTGFSSDYIYQGNISPNSIGVGYYGVVTDAQAAVVASTWATICPSKGQHLVVNGSTGQSGIKKAWQQTIPVTGGQSYKFCFDTKMLPPCAFDSATYIVVNTQAGSGNETNKHKIKATPGACNWISIEQTIAVPVGATSLTITISLDETMIGDGNDVAFDNLVLVVLPPVAPSQLLFGMTPINITASNYGMTVTASSPLSSGCTNYWEVEEVDSLFNPIAGTKVVNPSAWSSLTSHNFSGYNHTATLSGTGDAAFDYSKHYRIVYGRACKCEVLNKRYMIVGPVALNSFAKQAKRMMPQVLESGIVGETKVKKAVTISISEMETGKVKVFPNPTRNTLTVQMVPAGKDYQVKVSNSFGQTVRAATIKAGQTGTELSMKELAPGTYMLQIISHDGALIHTERVSKL